MKNNGKIKTIAYWTVSVLEVLLLIGAYVLNKLSKKIMGVNRFIVYENQQWTKKYPMETIETVGIIILALMLAALLLILWKKRKNITVLKAADGVIAAGFTLFTIIFALIYSVETLKIFNFLAMIFALVSVIQIVKTMAVLLTGKNEKA